jgi:hypothetical protein
MEVQDGFIVGVFNYCDRWCERCPLTSRCRLFADMSEFDFEEGNGPLTEPRMLRERQRLAAHLIEVQAEVEEACARPAGGSRPPGRLPEGLEPSFGPSPEVVANADALRRKARQLRLSANPAVRLAAETIQYYSLFVPMKMMRAFSQVARHGPGGRQSDANGSGKAALLALERMQGAWETLIATHHYSVKEAAPFLEEIARMQRNLQRAVPEARNFVRPGFDEPEEVRMLEASNC